MDTAAADCKVCDKEFPYMELEYIPKLRINICGSCYNTVLHADQWGELE